jgi:hypothetical protein
MIQIGQTKTVIAIRVAPIGDEHLKVEKTTESKKNLARKICSSILNDEVEIEIIKPTSSQIIKRNIKEKLLNVSFDLAQIQELTDGIHGLNKNFDPNDISDRSEFKYWWRRLNWCTDGKFVGIYTLKTEGGAWSARYNSKLDETWFEKPPERKKLDK